MREKENSPQKATHPGLAHAGFEFHLDLVAVEIEPHSAGETSEGANPSPLHERSWWRKPKTSVHIDEGPTSGRASFWLKDQLRRA
jgi:hypothetical protein